MVIDSKTRRLAFEHPATPTYHAGMVQTGSSGSSPRRTLLATARHAIAAAMGACALLLATSAFAQETYTLTDEDAWKQGKAVEPGTPEFQLNEARKALAGNDPDRAENLASQWIKRNERHPLLPDAYLIRGDALQAQGEEYEALFDYEFVARMYAGSDAFVVALQRELDIATQYAAGKHRKLWGLRIASGEDEAEELFIRVQERMPGSRLAEEAGMQLADFYFNRRRMSLAVDAYTLFIENYPHSNRIDKARRRLIYAYLASFKGPQYDATGLYEARARLKELKASKPAEADRAGADALLVRIDESDATKLYETARWYFRTGNPIAAERMVRRLVAKYPRSVATTDALRLIPQIMEELPQRIRDSAPDYQTMRQAVLGVEAGAPRSEHPASAKPAADRSATEPVK